MNVLKVDYQSPGAAALFTRSLQETGFGVLYGHPIDQQLIDEVYEEWKGFFASAELKARYLFNRESQDGYFPQSVSETAIGFSAKDLKEFYQIYPWGKFPAELSQRSLTLYSQLSDLAHTLLQWVEDHLPEQIAAQLACPLSDMITGSEQTMLRILHYPPMPNSETGDAVRAAAHGDINLLTVLIGATTTGLQVQDATGTWHNVPCDRDCIAVNIGDMLQLATQGFYRSTIHRVVNPSGPAGKLARLSMPLFLHPRPDVKLSEHYTAESFLKERLHAIGVL
ncbi:MAG: 2OG-Fe(II) oxygenase [Candidatus Melainabacteria bacterium HGW-Melainabacteria-1]|nr:MAG: 2OG-Fe(II) oxygenase [Candidatus Melainabacteria bacterium HGW-Melainabacteria-1]